MRGIRGHSRRRAATWLLAATVVGATAIATSGISAAKTRVHAAAAAPAWTSVFQRYTGGHAGRANSKLAPISIGWVNDEGGVVQSPESTVAVRAAISTVNSYLGGVQGHPLKLVTCSIVSAEAQGQTCAQQMLANPKIKFITEGVLTVGGGAFHQTLAGAKPVIGFNPVRIEIATASHTYEVTSGLFGTDAGFLGYLKSFLKAKTVSLLNPGDDPAGVQAAKTFVAGAQTLGIKVTQVPYQSSATDLVAPLTAAGAQSTDATVMFLVNTGACIAGAKATQELAIKHVLALSLCLIPDVAKGLGDYPKWTYIATQESANLPGEDPYVKAWLAAMVNYHAPNISPFPQLAFGTIMTDVKLLNQIGYRNYSSATFERALKAFHGPSMFGPPNLRWGTVPGLPALGTVSARLYTYHGHGHWSDPTHGKWVGLSQ